MTRIAVEFLNNDVTPMEDVVRLLRFAFGRTGADAFEVMLKVHRDGQAIVATFPEDRQADVEDRLSQFIVQMDKPIIYRVLPSAPSDPALDVNFSVLSDLSTFLSREADAKTRQGTWVLLLLLFGLLLLALYLLF